PLTGPQLAHKHSRGEVNDATLVWHAGMSGWEPLGKHAGALGLGARGAAAPMAAAASTATAARPALRASGGMSGCGLAIAVLFVGIMVIGVLAAIAVPAYSDYTERARVAEARMRATGLKLMVEEFRLTESRCPDNGEGGIEPAEAYADTVISG